MKFRYIDFLRGIAILLVIITHTSQSIPTLTETEITLFKFGQLGVQLFFVISAYTLCLSYESKPLENIPTSKFYIKRYFRIAPMYYIGILVYLIVDIASFTLETHKFGESENYSLLNIFSNVFLLHGIYMPGNNVIVPGGWSIGTEVLFYAVFPFVFSFFKKIEFKKNALLLMPLLAEIAALLIQSFITYITKKEVTINGFVYYSLIIQFPVFLLGMSLFFIEKNFGLIYKKEYGFIIVFLALLSLYILFNKQPSSLLPYIAGLCFSFCFILVKHSTFFKSKLIERIGQLSFSVYITHFLFAWYLSKLLTTKFFYNFPTLITFSICVLITLLLSYIMALVTEKYIEIPFINIGKKLSRYKSGTNSNLKEALKSLSKK